MADEVRLIDIIKEFISGDWGEENATEDAPCAVSCVRGADIVPISNSRFENIPVRYISVSSLRNRGLSEGDIIIEKSGGSPTQSTGRTVFVSKKLVEAKKNIVCSNFCQAFRIKEGWNPLYVYYYLQVVYNSGVFFNFEGKTSGLKNLILDSAFQSITIKKVPLQEQDRVANMLSLIDDKIAANHAINDYLEAMARQLYDYWFVQFDFPDENGKPYKSSGGKMTWNEKLKREIPEGWICGTLLDIASYTNGIACQNYRPIDENRIPVIKIKEMHDGFSSETEYVRPDIPDSVKVFNGDVLFSWSASLEVVLWAGGNGGLNQHIFKVTSKNGYPRSFYYYQLLDYIAVFKQMAEARKTTMGHITRDHLEQSTIALPPSIDLPNRFESKISPVFQQYIANQQDIDQSIKLRNELLPLLMNGQVSVKPLNNHLSAV